MDWAQSWTRWSDQVTTFSPRSDASDEPPASPSLLAKARIETHYAINQHFLSDQSLIDVAKRLSNIPVAIVHGRRDLVCPSEAAWSLHNALPESRLIIVEEGGHLAHEPAMIDALVGETQRIAFQAI
jgi:proline iminopeptidase